MGFVDLLAVESLAEAPARVHSSKGFKPGFALLDSPSAILRRGRRLLVTDATRDSALRCDKSALNPLEEDLIV